MRDERIVEQVLAGATLADVARAYGLTRQRVSQIVMAAAPGVDLRARRRALDGRVAAVREKARLEGRAEARTRVRDRSRQRMYTDEQLLLAVRRFTGAYGVPTIAAWQAAGMSPTVGVLTRRFGSWNRAVAAAGVMPRKASGSGRKFSDDDLLVFVQAFLSRTHVPVRDRGGPGAFDRWVPAGGPASSTIRVRFGSWGEAKRRAVALMT